MEGIQENEPQTELYPNLPIELYHHILSYLDIKDLFIVRLISRKLYDVVKEFHIKELLFDYNLDFQTQLDNFFYSNKPINYKNAVSYLKPAFLKCSSFNFRSLKRLRMDRVSDENKIELAFINQLVQLEYLDFFADECILADDQVNKLSLPNVKTLFLGLKSAQTLEIDCPAVGALGLIVESDFAYIKFAHPESVKFLRIYRPFDSSLVVFKKLEVFECPFVPDIRDLLSVYENLNELRVSLIGTEHKFDAVQQTMKQILHQKFVLARKSFNAYLCGVPLTCHDDLAKFGDDFKSLRRSGSRTLSLLVQEYARLSFNPFWLDSIEYDQLMILTRNQLPADFHNKFKSISAVSVLGQVASADHLIKFLSNCLSLSKLTIRSSDLGQAFYDQLASSVLLISLDILECPSLDHQFLGRLAYLKQFFTTQPFASQMLLALDELRYFRVFYFQVGSRYFELIRQGDVYILENLLMTLYEGTSLVDLIELIENEQTDAADFEELIDGLNIEPEEED